MAKKNAVAAKPATELKDMTMEQLKALEKSLSEARKELEDKSQSMQMIVTTDGELLKSVARNVCELVLPQLEFDMRLMHDVVAFAAWATDAAKGRSTMGIFEFKYIVRAVSTTKFKGAQVAAALDSLNNLLEAPAAEVQKFDEQYRENATALDACLQEIDKRKQAELAEKTAEAESQEADAK